MSRFDECLAWTLRREGAFTNHPDDAGKATNRGITQATYNRYRNKKRLRQQSVALATEEETREIYFSEYWERFHCEVLPVPVDLAFFDTTVLFSRPVQILQGMAGASVDGIFGPKTLEAVEAHEPKTFARMLVYGRMGAHLHAIVIRPQNAAFIAGWLNRCRALLQEIG